LAGETEVLGENLPFSGMKLTIFHENPISVSPLEHTERRKDRPRDMTFHNKKHSYGTLELSMTDFEWPQFLLSAQ
jgi:hypothetical protein